MHGSSASAGDWDWGMNGWIAAGGMRNVRIDRIVRILGTWSVLSFQGLIYIVGR